MNMSWHSMNVDDSMRLKYADFKRLPKQEKRMLLHRLPYEDFLSLTTALKQPVSSATREMEELTLQEVIKRQRGVN
jgi:hypothetical protein